MTPEQLEAGYGRAKRQFAAWDRFFAARWACPGVEADCLQRGMDEDRPALGRHHPSRPDALCNPHFRTHIASQHESRGASTRRLARHGISGPPLRHRPRNVIAGPSRSLGGPLINARASDRPSFRIIRRTIASGIRPKTPNEQSMSCQKKGMPRIGPQINANGITIRQAIMPNSTTQNVF